MTSFRAPLCQKEKFVRVHGGIGGLFLEAA